MKPFHAMPKADRTAHDERPTMSYDRSTNEKFDACLFIPALYDKIDKPHRLRVEYDPRESSLLDISIETTTSETDVAECITIEERLVLTTEQAVWLYAQLGRLIPRMPTVSSFEGKTGRMPTVKEG